MGLWDWFKSKFGKNKTQMLEEGKESRLNPQNDKFLENLLKELGIPEEFIENSGAMHFIQSDLYSIAKEEGFLKEDATNINEFENYESDGAVRADTPQEESGQKPVQDAAAFGSFQSETGGVNKENPAYIGGNGLAGGDFYEQTKGEIERLLKNYPKAESLSNLIENSDWVKISYGDNLFYVFGVIYSGGKAEYICYGVPAVNSERPPESMKELASYIPAPDGGFTGFWVMYQDAKTGATLKVAGA